MLQLKTKNNRGAFRPLARLGVWSRELSEKNSISSPAVLQPAVCHSVLGFKKGRPITVFCISGTTAGALTGVKAARVHRRRAVTAETLVWTEGLAGRQKAGDIPGLHYLVADGGLRFGHGVDQSHSVGDGMVRPLVRLAACTCWKNRLKRRPISFALAERTFLRDRGHQCAVGFEDHAAGQAAPGACAR
jgi:hypothetical protein